MEEDQEINKAIGLTEELLDVMGASYDKVEAKKEDDRVVVSIYTEKDSKILIGKYGANLLSLTRILNLIVKRKHGEDIQMFVDVNDYYKENLANIKKKALMVADRVRSFQVDMELEPMNPLERRFVHSLFSEGSGITTKSKGSGNERRVVVSIKKEEYETSAHEEI